MKQLLRTCIYIFRSDVPKSGVMLKPMISHSGTVVGLDYRRGGRQGGVPGGREGGGREGGREKGKKEGREGEKREGR